MQGCAHTRGFRTDHQTMPTVSHISLAPNIIRPCCPADSALPANATYQPGKLPCKPLPVVTHKVLLDCIALSTAGCALHNAQHCSVCFAQSLALAQSVCEEWPLRGSSKDMRVQLTR